MGIGGGKMELERRCLPTYPIAAVLPLIFWLDEKASGCSSKKIFFKSAHQLNFYLSIPRIKISPLTDFCPTQLWGLNRKLYQWGDMVLTELLLPFRSQEDQAKVHYILTAFFKFSLQPFISAAGWFLHASRQSQFPKATFFQNNILLVLHHPLMDSKEKHCFHRCCVPISCS